MSLSRILNQTAHVASVTGLDSYGKPTYGAPVARSVRVEAKRTLVTNAAGEEAVSNHRMWCLEAIALTDRVWLPGANQSNAEASNVPLTVSSCSDFGNTRTLYRVEL